ncbi:ABC transporter permease [Candidatus Velamenicoccus archaeovorus]|uniref:ABC transporter permease n=1 Tax=Velamenicoccus archaeovorus TaxID=1930593 RepID=A0A410P2D9_VELA1|nr:ABC transporter permease [Candidatus Velamenicoccus archaeovorus]QAT16367.1 ABC transporter permease [Candidatus Velamenicoccus archaeovorus]
MWERAKSIFIKEFKQIFRDPRMKTIIFITPLIQIILFGYAANKDINFVPTAIFDRDNTKESRELLRDFTYSKYFVPKYFIDTEEAENLVLDKGQASLVIRIDRGYGRDLEAGKDAQIQLAYDGTDSNTAMVVMGYANTIMQDYQYNLLKQEALERGGIKYAPGVDLRDRAWFNGNLISRNYYLPGVIAIIVTMMSLLLSSMAIVKEKEIGTMEQLIVSPLRPIELILGKLLPFGIIALVQVVLITALGVLWFRIPLRGNSLLLLLTTCIYLFTTLGIGLFISTISSTQQESMMSVFLFYLPTVLLSGFAYPIANMPQAIQIFTYLNPLRYFMIIIRGIFLKGVGITVLWQQMVPLLFIGMCVIVLSTLQFKRKMG